MTNQKEWRCFHCEEVFTNEDTARDHFGIDEHEWQAGCCDKMTLDQRVMRSAFICMHQELDATREEVHRLNNTDDALLIMQYRIIAKGLACQLKDIGARYEYTAIYEDTKDLLQMLDEVEKVTK